MKEQQEFYYDFPSHHLSAGKEISISHTVEVDANRGNLAAYVSQPQAELERTLSQSRAAEERIFDKLRAAASDWGRQAAMTQLLTRALEIQRAPPLDHTGNRWVEDGNKARISNMVYRMITELSTSEQFNDKTQQREYVYYASWRVKINQSNNTYLRQIDGKERRRYTDKAAALKYLEGRKAAFAHLFTEICPPVPPEHADAFMLHGLLLPGYTIAGQPSIQSGGERDRHEGAGAGKAEGAQPVAEPANPALCGRCKAGGRA